MDSKVIKYLAIACFAVGAVMDIIDCIKYFSFFNVIYVVGSVLIIVALLTSKPILSSIGFAFWATIMFSNFLQNIRGVFNSPLIGVVWGINIVVYVLLMLSSINLKKAKNFGFIAMILSIVRLLLLIIRNLTQGFGIGAYLIIWGVLLAVGSMLLGLAYDEIVNGESSKKIATSNLNKVNIAEESNVEKVVRLKAFLDDGLITREEFDEKKKQLLNL